MTQKLKIRIYAIFQFISFSATVALLITWGLIAFVISRDVGTSNSLMHIELWNKYIKEVFKFSSAEIGILASITAYSSLCLFIASWVPGWMILRVPDRNLFDSLFLLFLMFPIISNVFAFFGQVSTKVIRIESTKINKKKIIAEQTKIIALDRKKQKEIELQVLKLKKQNKENKSLIVVKNQEDSDSANKSKDKPKTKTKPKTKPGTKTKPKTKTKPGTKTKKTLKR